MLAIDMKRNKGFITNSYIFKYDSNGRIDNKLVDFLIVIALYDSNDIITMYPYKNREKVEFYDLNPELDIEESPKLKRVSQIAKFNQRY